MPKFNFQLTVPSDKKDSSSDLQDELESIFEEHPIFKGTEIVVDPRNEDYSFPENMESMLNTMNMYLNWLAMTSIMNGMIPLAGDSLKKFEHAIVEVRLIMNIMKRSKRPVPAAEDSHDKKKEPDSPFPGTTGEDLVVPLTEGQLTKTETGELHNIVHQVARVRKLDPNCDTMSRNDMISFIKTNARLLEGKDSIN